MLKKAKDHLASVNESYFQHLAFALHVAGVLIVAFIALIIHALVPALFERSASSRILRLADEIRSRQNQPHTH